jgi:hypothetical protein
VVEAVRDVRDDKLVGCGVIFYKLQLRTVLAEFPAVQKKAS